MSYKPKDKVNVINDMDSVTPSVWKRSVSFSNHSIRPNTRGGGTVSALRSGGSRSQYLEAGF